MHFFCTAGRGTEEFLVDELNATDGINKIEKTDGKVFFTATHVNSSLLSLKCAERLFVQIIHLPNVQFSSSRDIQNLGKQLAEFQSWNSVVEAFRKLKKQDEDINTPESQEPPPKKRLLDGCIEDENTITFRVSCKLSPSTARRLDAQAASRALGWHLRTSLKWKVDTRKPLIEVCVHIGGQGVTVGIPTSSKPLSQRSYVHDFGLRSTVAWIIGNLAEIQQSQIVLDPMCGAGTILLEARQSWPEAHYVGIDMCPKQLERAKKNVEFNIDTALSSIELILGNATCLPINSQCVDAILCDLPFGSKYLTVETVRKLLPKALHEFDRVLRPGGHIVLLTSSLLKGDLLREVSALSNLDHLQAAGAGPDQTVHTAENQSHESDVSGETEERQVSLRHPDSPVTSADPNRGRDLAITETLDSLPSKGSQKTALSKSGTCNTLTTRAWTVKRVHYLKLGETPSHVCVFVKEAIHE